jgi:formamidopyrimidine-DNA glycosylase
MPELPEVETMARDLDALLRGATIEGASVAYPKLLVGSSARYLTRWIAGMRIGAVRRRAKSVVIVEADGPRRLIFAPRMTGEPRVALPGVPRERHEHLRFPLADGRELRFADPRRFGRLTPALEEAGRITDLAGRDPFGRTGPEPLDESWDLATFRTLLAGRSRSRIKPLLLDQHAIAGIGNIYADEALWRARIHPERPAGSLTARESGALHRAIREILATAVERRGSRVATYRSPGGGASMQEALSVYGCGGEPCRRCRTSIRKYTLAGRGTHHCPVCQALP